MRRGADHSVVKSESKSVLGRKMTVYHVCPQLIGISQSGKKRLCLTGKIVPFSYGSHFFAFKS